MRRRQILQAGLTLLGASSIPAGWAEAARDWPADLAPFVPADFAQLVGTQNLARRDFSWDTVMVMWALAGALAYLDPNQVPTTLPAGDLTFFPKDRHRWRDYLHGRPMLDDTQAFCWSRPEALVVGYRGTEIGALRHHPGRIGDIITDDKFAPRQVVFAGGTQVTLHRGFYNSFDWSCKWLAQVLAREKKPCVFVGHSMGGAVASVAALWAKKAGFDVRAVYTFASPRAGDPIWARLYNDTLGPVTYRFANQGDPIPRVPPRASAKWSYRHVGQPVLLLPEGPSPDWNGQLSQRGNTWSDTQAMLRDLKAFCRGGGALHINYLPRLSVARQKSDFVPRLEEEPAP